MAETDLEVRLRGRRGVLNVDLTLRLEAGWTVLFGPSGSGKSTVLRVIAGLERAQKAQVVLGGEILLDTECGIFVPAHRRGIRMVAQRPGLFSEKNVHANIQFGHGDQARVAEVVRLCRVKALLDRKVRDLSGGERQRVALARTLAADGMRCLLLDEPFTGLDGVLRDEVLADLRAWLAPQTVPILLVTHDVGEALASEGRVIRLHEGQVVAQGPAAEVLAPELNRLRRRLEVSV